MTAYIKSVKKLLVILPLYIFLSVSLFSQSQGQEGEIAFFIRDNISYMGISAVINVIDSTSELTLHTDKGGHVIFKSHAGFYKFKIEALGHKALETHFTIEEGKELNADVILDQTNSPQFYPSKPMVSGYVIDRSTGEPINNAHIDIPALKKSFKTNKMGYFEINISDPIAKATDNMIRTDIHISKSRYKNIVYKSVLLYNGLLNLKIDMQPGIGLDTIKYSVGALEGGKSDKNENPNDKEIDKHTKRENRQVNSLRSSCSVPSSIRVGTSCSCNTCSSVSTMTLETYVGSGLDDEWISSWNAEALKAGAVAYRSYGGYFVNNPINTNYDISSTACKQAWGSATYSSCTSAASATAGEVVVYGTSGTTPAMAEYAAEANSSYCNSNDCYIGDGTYSCNYDNVCCGYTNSGNSRGMCQWGTQRWATNGQLYTWIVDHYYNIDGMYRCSAASSSCFPPSAPSLTSPGTSSCSGTSIDYTVDNYFYWSDNDPSIVGYNFQFSQYPYGTAGGCNGSDNNIIQQATCVLGTAVYIPANSLVPGMLYRWNVFAFSDCSNSACSTLSNTLYVQTPPVIQTSDPLTICQNGSVYLTSTYSLAVASPGSLTYTWYQNGNPIYTGPNYYYTATAAGTYTMAVNYSGSTCCSSGQTVQSNGFTVTVNPSPTTPGSITGSATVCSGSSIIYSVPYVSGVNYSWSLPSGWSGSSTTNSITVTTGGNSGTISVTAGNSCGTSSPSTLYVTVNSSPSVSANASPSSVCTNQQVTFTASGANSYSWSGVSGSSASVTKSYSSAGTYTVTVTGNPGGCSATATASVTVNPSPSVSVSPQVTPICVNQQATFNANGSGITSYTWSGQGVSGLTGQSVSPNPNYSSSGTYTVTVTVSSSNNCTATASGSIAVSPSIMPAITLTQSPSPVCGNGNNPVTITANPTNPGSSPLYTWSNGGGTANGNQYTISNITSSTVVNCTLTSNANCVSPSTATNSINIQVTQPATPTVTITTPSNTVCMGNVTFNATETNGGFLPSYAWFVNGTQQSGSSATFNYNFNSTGNSTVSCIMTVSSNACTNSTTAASNTLNITVQNQAPSSVLISTSDSIICAGTQITFNAVPSNGGSAPLYNWQINGGSSVSNNNSYVSNNLQNGDIVTCSMTSNSSCATNINSVSNAITMVVKPLPIASACCDTSICAGDPVILNASGGVSCLWTGIVDSNSCNPQVSPTTSRSYTARVIASNGCWSTAAIHISITSPTPPSTADSVGSITHVGADYIVCFYNKSINETSVRWDFGDGTQSTISNPCHTYTSSGPFIVTFSTYNSCGLSIDSDVIQNVVTLTSIESLNTQNLTILPNPSNGSFTLKFETTQNSDVEIKVFDVLGQLIHAEEHVKVAGLFSKQIDLSYVAKGVYILQIKIGEEVENRKIEIQ